MLNILNKYGINEVADVVLYNMDKQGNPTSPALFLDTLKISTIDQTSSMTNATGGRNNAPLITWDYGKDITINISDALFSIKTLGLLHNSDIVTSKGIIRKGLSFTGTHVPFVFKGPNGKRYFIPEDKIIYDQNGNVITQSELQTDQTYLLCFNITPKNFQGIEIKSDVFCGLYYLTGETLVRDLTTNEDSFCQFIIPKMKITSNFDFQIDSREPIIFSFSGNALKTEDDAMMKLVFYEMNEIKGDALKTINLEDLYDSLDRQLLAKIIWV